MGAPAEVSPQQRAAVRSLAAAIVRSVEEDKAMPHGLVAELYFNRPIYRRVDVEMLALKLAQEIVALHVGLKIALDMSTILVSPTSIGRDERTREAARSTIARLRKEHGLP